MDEGALRAAIVEHLSERAPESGLLLTDWVLVAATQGWDEEGDVVAAVVITMSDDSPYYRILGLLAEAETRARADVISEPSED